MPTTPRLSYLETLEQFVHSLTLVHTYLEDNEKRKELAEHLHHLQTIFLYLKKLHDQQALLENIHKQEFVAQHFHAMQHAIEHWHHVRHHLEHIELTAEQQELAEEMQKIMEEARHHTQELRRQAEKREEEYRKQHLLLEKLAKQRRYPF